MEPQSPTVAHLRSPSIAPSAAIMASRPSQRLKSDARAAAWHTAQQTLRLDDQSPPDAATAPETVHDLIGRIVHLESAPLHGHDLPPSRPPPPPAAPPPPPEPTTATDGKMLQCISILEKAFKLHELTLEPGMSTVAAEGDVSTAVGILIRYAAARIVDVDATTGRYGTAGPPARDDHSQPTGPASSAA